MPSKNIDHDIAGAQAEDIGLVTGADLSCLTCNTRTVKIYQPSINYDQFVYDKPNLICSACDEVYLSIPVFGSDQSSIPINTISEREINFVIQTIKKRLDTTKPR